MSACGTRNRGTHRQTDGREESLERRGNGKQVRLLTTFVAPLGRQPAACPVGRRVKKFNRMSVALLGEARG